MVNNADQTTRRPPPPSIKRIAKILRGLIKSGLRRPMTLWRGI
jgi:hypothetical protein